MNPEDFLVRAKPTCTVSDDIVAEKSPCGRYVRYGKILGKGAFKVVYKGFDLVDNLEIAWSQIFVREETAITSQENQERLFSEAVLLQSSNHENIMKCYGFWLDYDNKVVNIITELFASGSVRQYTKKLGCGVHVQTIKNWGRQILRGLFYLHTQNPSIVHRDLKCDNIFVDVGKGVVKIGDFGLATGMDQSTLRDLVGTPKFMAPEIYKGQYNELVDIYAFGMCLIEMATCEYPYSEWTNQFQIAWRVCKGEKPIALEEIKDVELKEIIEKCLLPASSRPSAMELLNDPFFSTGVSVETEHNHSQDLIVSVLPAWSNSISGSDCGKMQSSCSWSSEGDVPMSSQITFASSKDLFLYLDHAFLCKKS